MAKIIYDDKRGEWGEEVLNALLVETGLLGWESLKTYGFSMDGALELFIEHISQKDEFKSIFPALINVTTSEIYKKPFEKLDPIDAKPKSIIYNFDGYDQDVDLSNLSDIYQKGKSISLPEGTPIGYSIFLPENPVEAVLISVYGGHGVSNRKKMMEAMKSLSSCSAQNRYLLNKNIAIVKTALVDLIKLNTYQGNISKDLYSEIIESVKHLVQIFKYQPESLHPNLQSLLCSKVFLMGASFGGGLVVNIAQSDKPLECDGYIAYRPSLSWGMLAVCDNKNLMFQDRGIREGHLDTNGAIENLQKHLLILPSFNDNNVLLTRPLYYYEEAIKAGKSKLINLLISPSGNKTIDFQNLSALINIGHFPPEDKNLFEQEADYIYNFIIHGPSFLSKISEWRAFKYKILYDKYFYNELIHPEEVRHEFLSSLYDHFISYAYQKLQGKDEKEKREILSTNSEKWNEEFVSLFYAIAYLKRIYNQPESYQADFIKLREKGKINFEAINKIINDNFSHALEILKVFPSFEVLLSSIFKFEDIPEKIKLNDYLAHKYLTFLFNENNYNSESLEFSIEAKKIYNYLINITYLSNLNLINDPIFDEFKNKKIYDYDKYLNLSDEMKEIEDYRLIEDECTTPFYEIALKARNKFIEVLEIECSKIKDIWKEAGNYITDAIKKAKQLSSLKEVSESQFNAFEFVQKLAHQEHGLQEFLNDFDKINSNVEELLGITPEMNIIH